MLTDGMADQAIPAERRNTAYSNIYYPCYVSELGTRLPDMKHARRVSKQYDAAGRACSGTQRFDIWRGRICRDLRSGREKWIVGGRQGCPTCTTGNYPQTHILPNEQDFVIAPGEISWADA